MFNSLEVLLAWVRMHERQLEQTVQKKYLMQSFAHSEVFASSLVSLLKLSSNGDPALIAQGSLIPKLDDQLNGVKVKALDCIVLLTKYVYDEIGDEKKECPLLLGLVVNVNILMSTAISLASLPNFESITKDNEPIASLMTSILSLLAILSQDSAFYEAF